MSQLLFTEEKQSGTFHAFKVPILIPQVVPQKEWRSPNKDYGPTAGTATAAPKVNGPSAVVSVSVVPLMV